MWYSFLTASMGGVSASRDPTDVPMATFLCPLIFSQTRTVKAPDNWKVSIVCAMVAMALVAVAQFGPWYNVSAVHEGSDGELLAELSIDYRLGDLTHLWGQREVTYEHYTVAYSELPSWDTLGVFATTQVLAALPLLFVPLMLAAILLCARGKLDRRIALGLGVVAVVFTILSPAYFALALPGPMEEEANLLGSPPMQGFWGSDVGASSTGVAGAEEHDSWGPEGGWYLMIVAFMLLLAGTIASLGLGKEEQDSELQEG